MATPQLTALETTLRKIQEQLICSICLDEYDDPKVLCCFHVFCSNCVEQLARQSHEGNTVLCPNCRQLTTLPPNGVSGLLRAFHVCHLFDIRDTLLKINKTNCDRCKNNEATDYCRSCGFVCDRCKECHQFFKELSSHKIVSLDKLTGELTGIVPPQKKLQFCPRHEGKLLELFCKTCNERICHKCTTNHEGQDYDVVSNTLETHKLKYS